MASSSDERRFRSEASKTPHVLDIVVGRFTPHFIGSLDTFEGIEGSATPVTKPNTQVVMADNYGHYRF
jgi:hypothetical protein